ncbi:MAG TPA: 5-deoxy-glucuronate isomerase [Caulobacteraceae bacterium]
MSRLLVRPEDRDGFGRLLHVTPRSAGWRYVGFEVFRLAAGEAFEGGDQSREACLVVLCGTVDIAVGGEMFAAVGSRVDVFEDAPPGAVYAPAGAAYHATARSPAEIAVCTAPGAAGRAPRRISPGDMIREERGSGTNARRVRDILPAREAADSLLVVEVVTPGGHWSSYPPHKHDTAAGEAETALEEIYYHRITPVQGFAFQRVYTDDRSLDETLTIEDGDLVLVPRGYHPVAAAHGYDLYYLNVMAGEQRRWIFRNDPAHDWIAPKGAPSVELARS